MKKKKDETAVEPEIVEDKIVEPIVDETIDPAHCIKCKETEAAQLRAIADYQNLVRETDKQRMEFVKYASQGLVEDLIPTLDYFDAAMASKPDLNKIDETARKTIENWIVGVTHVQKLMMDSLEQQGVKLVDTSGMFDTSLHEAVEEKESDEAEGTILSVVANGYRMGDKLLRPARVTIAKGK
ncbi:MAG TPA: nucleotide exchange factor GrpE [Patescibacteria group bacterium]|nr:nucleotide exchange factor GrpE [Patescibacteria group bacterium]